MKIERKALELDPNYEPQVGDVFADADNDLFLCVRVIEKERSVAYVVFIDATDDRWEVWPLEDIAARPFRKLKATLVVEG